MRDIPESKAMGMISGTYHYYISSRSSLETSHQHANPMTIGYALALDMTARNVQDQAKKQGYPWTVAKGFDTFTPISEFIPSQIVKDPHNLDFWLKVRIIC